MTRGACIDWLVKTSYYNLVCTHHMTLGPSMSHVPSNMRPSVTCHISHEARWQKSYSSRLRGDVCSSGHKTQLASLTDIRKAKNGNCSLWLILEPLFPNHPNQPIPVCDKSEKWEKLTDNRRGQGLGITANVDIRQVWEMGETNQRNGSNWPIIIGNLGFTTNVDIRWDLAISVPRIGWKPLRVAITSKKIGSFIRSWDICGGQSADSWRYYRALLSQN